MAKTILSIFVFLYFAIYKGEIHNNKDIAANAMVGVLAGIFPFILDLVTGLTEFFKMIAALAAAFVALISLYRIYKPLNKEDDKAK